MVRIFGIIFAGIITSFFYFPFPFRFFPVTNTKNILAGIGVGLFLCRMARTQNGIIRRDFVELTFWGIGVSLAGLLSLTINDTQDYAYATYVRSMWIWISAAYVVVNVIRWVHGKISVPILINYLLGVCVFQCIIAILIDNVDFVKDAVHTFLPPMDFMENVNRLYGIGASLDVGGSRFAAVLIMTAYIIASIDFTIYKKYLVWYIWGAIVVSIIGNMIARTTTAGLLLAGLLFFFRKWYVDKALFVISTKEVIRKIILIAVVILPIIIYLYNTNDVFRHDLRFAFEGFFNLFETGEWNVASNNKLKTMYIWPDNFKTWLIGDGYFDNPFYLDPYYSGPNYDGYYKATDAGYLRFIYYFGMLGLTIFMLYMYRVYNVCVSKFQRYKLMFLFLLLLNFVVWIKVSTDIFLVFAPFLLIEHLDENVDDKVNIRNDNNI